MWPGEVKSFPRHFPELHAKGLRCSDKPMLRLVILILACLAVTGCANELILDKDGALAVIPRQVSDAGHIVVETRLNGLGPFRFVIDTGASISVVFESAREKARIEPLSNIQVRVHGMTGSGLFPLGRVSDIRVGDVPWQNANVALLPRSPISAGQIDGILGVDFLSQYAVLSSQRERVLRFYPRDLVADDRYRGWERILLRELRVGDGNVAVFVFDMYIDAEYIPTLFDLGAAVNLMNRRAARALDIMVRKPRSNSEVQGVSGSMEVLAVLKVWRLWIDNSLW